ncbi:tRNA epoxyqueuosine(34) reductase QueG [Magnetospirillum aberrantis]|uniref:Epoxyqueuosine reductase n=1 Tax=Magnetospirillum aberrantis SpK TaxID=908842 RepID=A0A7C9UV51_9PROT|nr:tRNA epoxyqueuosine(34) reductase QueG [Magnetospirillum aberrantis SpK]
MAGADPATVKEAIRAKALELGFDAVGFAPANGEWSAGLEAFVADGRHGTMAWMEERREQRAAPKGLWPDVRSVVVLGTSYAPAGDPLATLSHPTRGHVSVYARNKDYHDLMKRRLKALGRWMVESFGGALKVFVDTAPVMEKPLAAQSGIGWQGRHSNVVSRRFGSWLFLSEIYTTLEIEADPPEPDHCGKCTRCRDACPTGAIVADGQVDARRCVSYLTIEHKGAIPEDLRPLMGNRVYGCDDCMAACPWNKFAPPTREADFLPRMELVAPRLSDLAELDDSSFREVFSGSAIKRVGRDRWLRNVLVAIGNSDDIRLIDSARAHVDDPNETVRETARWAVNRLAPHNGR